jgi:hypothetical protein
MRNLKLIFAVVLFFGIFGLTRNSFAQTYYVSPMGDDSNAGTVSAPFKTIERARNVIRTINTNMQSDITVYLRGAMHELDHTILLDQSDSGTNGHNVIYRNYPGEIAVISGGRTLTGWVQDGSNWKVNVGTAFQTRQLYVNYVRATRARSVSGLPGGVETATGYTTTDANMKNWVNKVDVEFVANKDWKQFRCGVSSIVGSAITMKQPCWGDAQSHVGFTMDNVTWIENAYELLDTPGEWYLNRTTGWLYYKPMAGEVMNVTPIIAPVLETLISGHGTDAEKIHNIKFQGLRFAYATWLEPNGNNGFSETQGNYHGHFGTPGANGCEIGHDWCKRMPANVDFGNAESIEFERNRFVHLGAAGLSFGDGSSNNNKISGNVFQDISGNGLMLGDAFADGAIPTNNIISNNYVNNVATEYHGGVGIYVGVTINALIEQNELENLPYSGISIGTFTASNSTANNKIKNNYIHDYMKVLHDGGGIYSMGKQPNGVYSGNYITGQVNEYGAIYFDSLSRWIELKDNVVFGNKRTAWIKYNDGDDNQGGGAYYIHDNWWQDRGIIDAKSDIGLLGDDYGSVLAANRIENNHVITSVAQAPTSIINNAGLQAAYLDIKNGDTIKPIVTINTKPAVTTNQLTATFTFSSNEVGNFLCSLDSGAYEVCASPNVYANLSASTHTFSVKAVDEMNNISSPVSYDWNIQVSGTCGAAQGIYLAADTYWRNPVCAAGLPSPLLPWPFLAPGATMNWQCVGENGGTTASCSATRASNAVIPNAPSGLGVL